MVSAIAVILKDNTSVRLIHDGSRQRSTAMDDYSSPEHVKFQTLQDACKLAKPVFRCVKVDLQSTYRSVCIHSDNYKVTGLKWTFQGDSKDTQLLDS